MPQLYELTTGIAPFDRLVTQVMTQSPYAEARRVFWILDNGSSHRGEASVRRLQAAFPTLIPVHGPVHASWLNQIEIYFSILERKALTPNDFSSLADVEDRLLGFERYYESIATPFYWRFTKVATFSPLVGSIREKTTPDLEREWSVVASWACMSAQLCYHACIMSQLTVRGVPDEVRRRLSQLSQAGGESLNTTIRRILERAVGADERRQRLEEYATWSADDLADFERALAGQRTIDADLWR